MTRSNILDRARKMPLGPRPDGWAPWSPQRPTQWPREWGVLNDRYWPKPYERLFKRIDIRQRYRVCPKPWEPGRYRTAKWEPYHGYGRFSGLAAIVRGGYCVERYTGVRVRPEDYRHHSLGPITPEETERNAAYWEKRRRQYSWRFAA